MHPISGEIEEEFALIGREVDHLSVVLQRLAGKFALQPDSQEEWESTTLCASAIEKIYTGCERVMAKLATEVDGEKVDKGDAWHRALLDRMRQPFQNRQSVITDETYGLLDRMRAFRHRERNSYSFNLDTAIVLDRAREAIQAYKCLTADIRRMLAR